MIFVTVGTHEQQFDRLVRKVDELKRDGKIEDEIFVQTGYSTYIPEHCRWEKMLPYKKMQEMVSTARIVITHGGPSSFIMPLQCGKVPIVVPRKKEFGEHVNDHQEEFVRMVSERQGDIIPVYDINKLGDAIRDYDNIVSVMPKEMKSNNARFNEQLEAIVDRLMEKGRQRGK